MKFIAHRGNTEGPNPRDENYPDYIDHALLLGYDAEIDLWLIDDKLMLGHDNGQYEVAEKWLELRSDLLWIHCKNKEALDFMTKTEMNYFWHNTDDYTITSQGFIWAYPGKESMSDRCVLVMPETVWKPKEYLARAKYGICSDFVGDHRPETS